MHRAYKAFIASMQDARLLTALYEYLTSTVLSPFSYDDLLRSQIVYSVGAFDKLIHELIRIGMVATFMGTRTATAKYQAELIPIHFHNLLSSATIPPKEVLFEQEMAKKLKTYSFQDPDKIADGLAYIWEEKHKWTKIACAMGITVDQAKTQLKLIVGRRNEIVHESDSDLLSNVKKPISKIDCKNATDFIELCGKSILDLVI